MSGIGAATLAAGGSTTFEVTFKPTAAGNRTALVRISSNDADENPFDIELTGKGTTSPEIVVEQPEKTGLADGKVTKNFGSVKVGKSSSTKTFTIRNKGTAKLTGLAIVKNGAAAKDFIVTQPLKSSLPTGADTTFQVTFKPTGRLVRSAAIRINSNDTDESPFDIKLSGVGSP